MSAENGFRSLGAVDRLLVAAAVLLDGREAGVYLENDLTQGEKLKAAALDLAGYEPELRMPLVGSILRSAVGDLPVK
jgi:hypothetical protein